MRHCNILLSALATVMTLASIMPCGASAADAVRAASLGHSKAIARRVYEEGLNLGRFEAPYSPGFVGHGADGMVELKGFREAFPDLKVTVDNTFAERDLVAVHRTSRGTDTRTGPSFPMKGRAVLVTGTTLFRMAEGRIAEDWTCGDSLGRMKQLGMLPTPATGSATGSSPTGGTAH